MLEAYQPVRHPQQISQQEALTAISSQAPAQAHAQRLQLRQHVRHQLQLHQRRPHLRLLQRCQRHADDAGSWPRWAHNPEREAPFLEPDQYRKTVLSDVAGVLQLTELFALPHSQNP